MPRAAAQRSHTRLVVAQASPFSWLDLPFDDFPAMMRPPHEHRRQIARTPTGRAPVMPKITPFLWFDSQLEGAVQFYVSIFPNSRVLSMERMGKGGPVPKGTVFVATFELEGQRFMALNGGPLYKFTEA